MTRRVFRSSVLSTLLTAGVLVVPWILLNWSFAAGAAETDSERSVRRFPTKQWQPESSIPEEFQKAPWDMIWEVTRLPDRVQTPEQKQIADDLVEQSFQAAVKHRWLDFEIGAGHGFKRLYNSETHYAKNEYVLDDAILDPERPEFLMYYISQGVKVLAGFMFLVREPLEQGPQSGGSETLWHFHRWSSPQCLFKNLLPVAMPDENGKCTEGTKIQRSPEMLHIWLLDHPGGRFASDMSLDRKLLINLVERRKAERGF
jgi:hypothetical protein